MEGEGLRSIFASPQLKDKDNDNGERDGVSPQKDEVAQGVELHGRDGLLVDSVGAKNQQKTWQWGCSRHCQQHDSFAEKKVTRQTPASKCAPSDLYYKNLL